MKILPMITQPWPRAIVRRHAPKRSRGKTGFSSYRSCLRWDFGFSCAFCLCHEADLASYPIQGSGLTHIEHFVPKSLDNKSRNTYSNCFYACRFCNVSRGTTPSEGPEGKLLNPCDRAWEEAFVLADDRILPSNEDDRDAVYTLNAYRLNDPPKVKMRWLRRRTIGGRVECLQETQNLERDLLDAAVLGEGPRPARLAKTINKMRVQACEDLWRFRAVPDGYDTSCSCGKTDHHSLPAVLDEQTIDLSLSDLRPARRGDPPSDSAVDSLPN